MALTSILWDFGGVLTTSPFAAFRGYEADHGIPQDFIRTLNATNPETNAWAQFERSAVTLDEFDQLFLEESTRAGHPVPGRQVIELLSGELRPGMVAALDIIRKKFRTACITNNVRSGPGASMTQSMTPSPAKASAVAAVMDRFEIVLESSVEGIRKPNPAIYQLACERLGIHPTEALFIDDLGINLKPARELGMQTIKVRDEPQALAELELATGLTLRPAPAP